MGERHICALDWGGLELMAGRLVGRRLLQWDPAHDFEPLSRQKAAAYAYENCIPVEEPQVSEMPFEWYITLKNGLWWKTRKDDSYPQFCRSDPGVSSVDPSAILLLKENSDIEKTGAVIVAAGIKTEERPFCPCSR